MSPTFFLFLPLLLTLGVGAATQGVLTMTPRPSMGRSGAALLGAQLLVVGGAVGLALADLAQPREERCPIDGGTWVLAIALLLGAAVVGGLLLATVIADGRKHSGVLVWHLLAAPLAVVLPYVSGFAYLYWGLSCTS